MDDFPFEKSLQTFSIANKNNDHLNIRLGCQVKENSFTLYSYRKIFTEWSISMSYIFLSTLPESRDRLKKWTFHKWVQKGSHAHINIDTKEKLKTSMVYMGESTQGRKMVKPLQRKLINLTPPPKKKIHLIL